jgi:hypothetical protein
LCNRFCRSDVSEVRSQAHLVTTMRQSRRGGGRFDDLRIPVWSKYSGSTNQGSWVQVLPGAPDNQRVAAIQPFLFSPLRRSIEAENLVLRRQLALFNERGVKPRRIDAASRLSLAWLSRLCDWRSCVIVVRTETVVRRHRAGWRLFWRYKSRPGHLPAWRLTQQRPRTGHCSPGITSRQRT